MIRDSRLKRIVGFIDTVIPTIVPAIRPFESESRSSWALMSLLLDDG